MSSDLYVFDESLLYSESFSPIVDSFTHNMETNLEDPCFLDQFIADLAPSHQMESLSLYQSSCSNLGNGYGDSGVFEVKSEDLTSFAPHSYSGGENVVKMMQRSFSSNFFDQEKTNFCFQPQFDTVAESPDFQSQPMRRVCSTGDLQSMRTIEMTQRSLSSPLAAESSFMEDSSFKVGRYSAEERKERILKYRAKRNQRNFNKTIKYACRKTLADNRPRIRGRFARNDETGDTPKASCSARDDEDDDFLLDGLVEEEHGHGGFMGLGGGPFMNHYGQAQAQTQFHYYGY